MYTVKQYLPLILFLPKKAELDAHPDSITLSKKDTRSIYIPDWSIQFLISIFLCTSSALILPYLRYIIYLSDKVH